jgi:hypothetical protein
VRWSGLTYDISSGVQTFYIAETSRLPKVRSFIIHQVKCVSVLQVQDQ